MTRNIDENTGDDVMDQNEITTIARNYAEKVLNHFRVKKVVLFGSQAKGNSHKDSDIDIAVIVEKLETDFLESEAKLYKLRREIDLRIEPILLEEMNDSSGFINQVMSEGEIIFNSEHNQRG
jgi:predicted nucleotidyltransferase